VVDELPPKRDSTPDAAALHQTAQPDTFANLQKVYSELTEAQGELERRAATIEEMRELFERVVESMADALVVVDSAGRVEHTNAAARQFLGREAGALTGIPFAEISPSPEIPATPKALLNRAPDGVLRNLDLDVRLASGRLLPVSVSCGLVRDKFGKITGLLIVARDITERREAERRGAVQYAVTRIFGESATFETAGQKILEAICEGLNFEAGEVWLREGDLLRCAHTWSRTARTGEFSRQSRELTFRLGEGLPGRVWETTHAQWVVDLEQDPSFLRRDLARAAGLHSAAAFPLQLGEHVLGVMGFFSNVVREPNTLLLDMMTSIGSQIGQFIERKQAEEERGTLLVRLYEREHEIAETLQRSLLPERLPDIPGVLIAARYLPGTAAAVGGDWYDVMPLPGGRIGMVMGDVAGRGVRAAAVMGQLRNAMRAYANEDYPPAEVAQRLNQLIELGEMATLVYLVYDPASQTLHYVNAGHLPPLVLTPDGGVRRIEGAGSPPLGGLLTATYVDESVQLDFGSTVLIYTDGLVEVKREGIDRGLTQLEATLQRWHQAEPELLLEQVVASLLHGKAPADDVALLALRITALNQARLQLRVPAVPASVGDIRRAVQRWLEAQDASAADVFDFAVGVSEAAGNAVEHAYGAADAEIEVMAERRGDDGIVTIRDWGKWRPARGTYRGRGLSIMEKMMDTVDVQPNEDGTTVILQRRIGRR
jgi:PAS domain S-box-containing protein